MRYLPVIDLIKKYKLKNNNILEIGSGDLGITPYLKKKVVGLDIFFPLSYRELANVYAKQGEITRAQQVYEQALDILPDIDNPYMNDSHKGKIQVEKYIIFKNLANMYFKENDFKQAEEYYLLAYNNNLADKYIYKMLASIYYSQGDLDKAIWYNKRGYDRNPKDYIWLFAMALLYDATGDKVRALDYAQEALELEPGNKQIEEFINNVE